MQESPGELRDIFARHDVRTVSKSLTFQYDKILYLMDPTEENSRLAGEKIKILDYPDGTLAFHYGHRSLKCRAFDKLACVDRGQIVDNKRLRTVLRLAQVKQDERESEGKRERSKNRPAVRLRCASRTAPGYQSRSGRPELVCGKFKAIESTISAAKYRNSEPPKGYLR